MRLGVVGLLAITACGRSHKDCIAESNEVSHFLTTMDHDMPIEGTDQVHLVMRGDEFPHKAQWLPVVRVGPTTIQFKGAETTADALGERLIATKRLVEEDVQSGRRHGVDPGQLYLVIDEAAPWGMVVDVLRAAARAEMTKPGFVFARKPATAPAPRTPIDDELDKTLREDVGNRATAVAKLTMDVVKSCDALSREFGRVAAVAGEDKADVILHAVGPALVECECKVDIPALRSILWRVAGNPHPAQILHVELDPRVPPLDLPNATPWREASKHLTVHTLAMWPAAST